MDDRKPKGFRILWGSVFAQLAMGAAFAYLGIEFLNKATQ